VSRRDSTTLLQVPLPLGEGKGEGLAEKQEKLNSFSLTHVPVNKELIWIGTHR